MSQVTAPTRQNDHRKYSSYECCATIASNREIRSHLTDRASFIHEKYLILREKMEIAAYSDDTDALFRHLFQIKATTPEMCERVCQELGGNFYIFRPSSTDNKIVKSYLTVQKYDIYKKIPTFEHFKKDTDEGPIRYSRGAIIDVKNRYILQGLIHGVGKAKPIRSLEYAGIKTLIIDHGSYTSRQSYKGIYLSSNDAGSYEFGPINMIRTSEKYNEKNIGNFDIQNVPKKVIEDLFLALRDDGGAIQNWRRSLLYNFQGGG